MNIYAQNPRGPWNLYGIPGMQSDAMQLLTSYSFKRGKQPVPFGAPNGEILPVGTSGDIWRIWDLSAGDVLSVVPWVDVARQEAVIFTEGPQTDPDNGIQALAGFIRPAPLLPEYFVFAQCGIYALDFSDQAPDTNPTFAALNGLMFSGNSGLPPDASTALVTIGMGASTQGSGQAASLAQASKWTDWRTPLGGEPNNASGSLLSLGRAFVRAHVFNATEESPTQIGYAFSPDGSHWISPGDPLLYAAPIDFFGFVGTGCADASESPAPPVNPFHFCSEIQIWIPKNGTIDPSLVSPGTAVDER